MSCCQHGHSLSGHQLLVKRDGAHAGESFFGRALTGAAARHAAQKQGKIGAASPGWQDVTGKAIRKCRGKFRHTAFQIGISPHFRECLRVHEADDHDAHAEKMQRRRRTGLHRSRSLRKKLAHPLGPVSHPRIELLLGKEAGGCVHGTGTRAGHNFQNKRRDAFHSGHDLTRFLGSHAEQAYGANSPALPEERNDKSPFPGNVLGVLPGPGRRKIQISALKMDKLGKLLKKKAGEITEIPAREGKRLKTGVHRQKSF